MRYALIPFALIAIFIVYILYLLIFKRDTEKIKSILYPGLFFTLVWVVVYWLWLK